MPERPQPKIHAHPRNAGETRRADSTIASHYRYAELHVTSNFTFLTGASHPEELIEQAARLGHRAVAVTDRHTLAGIVRAHVAAKQHNIPLAVGTRVDLHHSIDTFPHHGNSDTNIISLTPGRQFTRRGESLRGRPGSIPHKITSTSHVSNPQLPAVSLLLYPTDAASYGRLCRLLTLGKRRAPKGECYLCIDDLLEHNTGLLAIIVPPRDFDNPSLLDNIQYIHHHFTDDRLSLAASLSYDGEDRNRHAHIALVAARTNIPMVATNDVHYHHRARRPLQDVITCIRHGCTLDEAGFRLFPNAERCLKPPDEMARLFAEYPSAIARTVDIADRATAFSLDELRYQYPDEICPPGKSAMEYLMELTWKGVGERLDGERHHGAEARRHEEEERVTKSSETIMRSREPLHSEGASVLSSNCRKVALQVPSCLRASVPSSLLHSLAHEFELIRDLNYAPYFLTVHDIVTFARSRGILCQGRGAAANSAVCYYLGITSVDPRQIDLLFERFVSKERNEPPDIDIDFEHERREEVIQYIYNKYGRERAALTAEVITYRGRLAVREVGKALGLSLDAVDRLAKNIDWWTDQPAGAMRVRELGFDPDDPTIQQLMHLSREILGFPRHLSQHVGGFVITRGPLCEMVPVENAAMPDRTIIEWDKDDIDAMGMLKVDCLGLGMLTCLNKAFGLIQRHKGTKARRHEGKKRSYSNSEVEYYECDQDISGFDSLAEGDGNGATGLSNHRRNAGGREIRINESDAPRRSIDSIEHRRGLRTAELEGLSEIPSASKRITRRTVDAIGIVNLSQDVGEQSCFHITARRDGSCSPRSYPKSAEKDRRQLGALPPIKHHAADSVTPPCLRASVPSCLDLASFPPEDPAVYDMICAADTVGVFQIESRAQMTMLPRLKPRCFYDLVIEVAIVRPGPIQGDMVHPYLRRRNKEEPVSYPSDAVKRVLAKTLGIPLFQEQAMSLAMVAAGFTAGEADQLRRAMAAWKRKGDLIAGFETKFITGMLERGYERDFAERCFSQIRGFSEYGFPESHAASFAHIVYASAWLKKYHPAAFAAALINSQPMGFYAPAQIVRDAAEHGVEIRGADVNYSKWDCTLERGRHAGTQAQRHEGEEGQEWNESQPFSRDPQRSEGERANAHNTENVLNHKPSCLRASVPSCLSSSPSLRLGLRLIKGLRQDHAEAITAAVEAHGPFDSIAALWRASNVPVAAMRKLANADAFQSLGLDRQSSLWHIRTLRDDHLPLFDNIKPKADAKENALPQVTPLKQVVHDYGSLGLSLKNHPLSFLRDYLDTRNVTTAMDLRDEKLWPQGRRIAVAGLALCRQRPATASGLVFMTLEDETAIANLIIRPKVFEKYRSAARHGIIVLAHGWVERMGDVIHVQVYKLESLDEHIAQLTTKSRNFH